MKKDQHQILILTGVAGLMGAVLVGMGEFLLHFDALARYSPDLGYSFMIDVSEDRLSQGHFLAVLGLPLYLLGCWHIYLMLKPANHRIALITLLVGAYGFVIGGVWIGSRAQIGSIYHLLVSGVDVETLIPLYEMRYENLLTITRITTLLLSLSFLHLVLTGRSYYRKWAGLFNPILWIILCFLIFLVIPSVGKYLMPIALNVAFLVFFVMSMWHVKQIKVREERTE